MRCLRYRRQITLDKASANYRDVAKLFATVTLTPDSLREASVSVACLLRHTHG